MERRLAAILAADVVGYSRLMAGEPRDQRPRKLTGAHERLAEYFQCSVLDLIEVPEGAPGALELLKNHLAMSPADQEMILMLSRRLLCATR